MLGKLLKYEIPAMGRKLLPLYAAWAVTALLLGLTAQSAESKSEFMVVISALLYTAIATTIFVVEEDVAFAPENLGVPTEEIRRRVDDALEAVGMTEFTLHAPHLLSGGQKQRIAIAGVLAMLPECIVLDESTAMLDPMGRREVLNVIEGLHREKNITVVLITHHMNEAEHADRVLVMNDGKLAMDGTPREVFSRAEELVALGLAVPDTVALLRGLHDGGVDIPTDAITVEDCADAIVQAFSPRT